MLVKVGVQAAVRLISVLLALAVAQVASSGARAGEEELSPSQDAAHESHSAHGEAGRADARESGPFKRHRIAFYTGAGREFEEHENLWVWKFGVEYGFPLPGDWDVAIGVSYDY